MTRIRMAVALGAVALLGLGCFGESRAPKSRGTALWISPESEAPGAAALERLSAQGIGEYFVEAAQVQREAGRMTLKPVHSPRLPRRERTTLVISGTWPVGDLDSAQTARELSEAIAGLRLEADRAGQLPVGIHFDVETRGAFESLSSTLRELRELLDPDLYLSASVTRRELDREDLPDLLEPLDFVVAFLYGQRPGEVEESSAWDLLSVERAAEKLDRAGRPYYLGAVIIGTASWHARGGASKAEITELDLASLVGEDKLELKRGFTLEGIDRQVYEFRARFPVEIGAWRLASSESIRVVRAATTNIEELIRRAGAWQTEQRLGLLFWRLPGAAERLSMSAANLADALAPAPSHPALDLIVERSDARRDEWTLRLSLANRNDEATDLAFFEANFVDLSVGGGRIADVDPGDFARFELYREGERATMRALREADKVRLYAPIVEGRQHLGTGSILLKISGKEPVIRTSGRFVLTDGEMLDLELREWTFGGDR